ncbi:MAG: phage tail tape measure protein, partial [Tepidiformaceae bacterium]
DVYKRQAMDVWGIKASDMTGVVNNLAGAANVSKFGVEDMSYAMAQGGGVAAAAGVSFDDFAATIAATSSSFSSGADAGTSFKTFITALANPTAKAQEAMDALGFSAYDASGNMKSMADITQGLHDALGPLSEQQRAQAAATIFGSDAMRTALSLSQQTGAEFTALSNTMKNTDAAAVAAQRMSNLSGDLEALKGSLESAGIAIGSRAIPALAGLAQKGTEAVNAFGALPSSTQNMLLLSGAAAAAAPLMATGAMKAVEMGRAIGTMGDMATSTKVKLGAMAGVAGIGALVIAGDIIAQKTTGHGLMEWIIGDPARADAASDALARLSKAMENASDAGEQMIIQDEINRILKEQADIVEDFEGIYNGYAHALREGNQASSEAKGMTEGLAEAMLAAGSSTADMKEVAEQLPPALRAIFEEKTKLKAAIEGEAAAMAVADTEYKNALDDLNNLTGAHGDLGGAVAETQVSAENLASYVGGEWGTVIGAVFDSLRDKGVEDFDTLKGKFPETITDAESLRDYLENTFGVDVAKEFDKVAGSAEEHFGRVVDAIGSILPSAQEEFDAWKVRLEQAVVDNQTFGTNITTIYAGMKEAGVAMPREIAQAVGEQGPAYAAMFARWYAEDPEAALAALALVAPATSVATVDSIINAYEGAAPGMTGGMQTGIVDPINAQMAAAQQAAWTSAKATSDGMGPSLAAGMDDITSTVDTYFGAPALAAIAAAGTNMKSGATTAGADAGEGLGIGLDSKVGRVIAAAANLGQTVLNTLAGFGHSPWPGMAEHGVDAVDGFIMGMASKEAEAMAMAAAIAANTLGAAKAVIGDGPTAWVGDDPVGGGDTDADPILNPYGRPYSGTMAPRYSNSGILLNARALRARGLLPGEAPLESSPMPTGVGAGSSGGMNYSTAVGGVTVNVNLPPGAYVSNVGGLAADIAREAARAL